MVNPYHDAEGKFTSRDKAAKSWGQAALKAQLEGNLDAFLVAKEKVEEYQLSHSTQAGAGRFREASKELATIVSTKTFDKELFRQVSNPQGGPHKPIGGFWLEAVPKAHLEHASQNGYLYRTEWERLHYWDDEDGDGAVGERVEYVISPDAKILVIDKMDDYKELLDSYGVASGGLLSAGASFSTSPKTAVDWVALAKDYDGFYATESAVRTLVSFGAGEEEYWKTHADLYGWDVPSIVIFNPEVLEFRDEAALPATTRDN